MRGDVLFEAKNVLVDGDYNREKFSDSVHKLLGCSVEIAKHNELHIVTVIPQRGG